jgi:hypothetical protein
MTGNAATQISDQPPGWLCDPARWAQAVQLQATIPTRMQEANRWLLHRGKQPFYPDGTPRRGVLDTPEDAARMGSFGDALRAYEAGGFDGIGFALGDGWQGIDLDYIEANGLAHLVDKLPGYVEHSPSGKGVHAIGFGESFNNLDANASGVEAYCSKRFFTITGDQGRGTIACIAGFVRAVIEPLHSFEGPEVGRIQTMPMLRARRLPKVRPKRGAGIAGRDDAKPGHDGECNRGGIACPQSGTMQSAAF